MTRKIYLGFITFCLTLTFFAIAPANAQAQGRKQRKKARKLAAKGEILYRRRKYEQAIEKYAEALAIMPTFPFVRFSKGFSHFNLKQYEQATTELDFALQQGYDPLEVYAVRWRAYFLKKDIGSALEDVKKAQELDPANDYFYIAEGQISREKKDFSSAIGMFEKAANMGSKNGDLYFYLAESYNAVGRFTEQSAAANKALKTGTRFPGRCWYFIGDALQREYKYEKAINAYKTARATNPEIYEAYVNLADTYRNLNQFNKAVKVAQEAVRKYPNDANLYVSLSWYYSLANKNIFAISVAKKAIEISPNSSMAHTNLCRAYNDTKQYDLAIKTCNKALDLTPGDGETHFYLGRSYQLLGKNKLSSSNYRKAVRGLIKTTQDRPDYSDGFYLLGNAHFANGQKGKAIKAYEDCLAISPLFARARYNLGYVHMQNGSKNKAREQHDELKKIDKSLAGKLLAVIEKE